MDCPYCSMEASDEKVVFRDDLVWFVRDRRYQGALKHSGIIIPVAHRETAFDLTEAEVIATFRLLLRVKAWMDDELSPDGYNIGWNCGRVGGQEVFHAHLHVIPRFSQEPLAGQGIRAHLKSEANRWERTPMRPELVVLLNRLIQSGRYEGLSLDNINATDLDGDNALHSAVVRNDLEAARLLIEAGINIDQHGDLGYTPLHNACSFGHKNMVLLLIESGADVHALGEGETPFRLARIRGHAEICELMRAAMLQKQDQDPHVWTKARIGLLRREIARLERQMESKDQGTPPD